MSFRKFFDMAGIGASALKKSNLKTSDKEKPSLKNIARLGKASAVKKPFQHVRQHIETTKKKKKTEDLKISSNSKKTKLKSNKGTSYSGPGDANL